MTTTGLRRTVPPASLAIRIGVAASDSTLRIKIFPEYHGLIEAWQAKRTQRQTQSLWMKTIQQLSRYVVLRFTPTVESGGKEDRTKSADNLEYSQTALGGLDPERLRYYSVVLVREAGGMYDPKHVLMARSPA